MPKTCLTIADFLPRSKVNGPGIRSVLWVQGCPLRCAGCFNPDFLPFTGGKSVAPEQTAEWMLAEADTEGVTFSGGEPFAQAAALAQVAARVQAGGKGVLIFTGCDYPALQASRNTGVQQLLAHADLLIAGPYVSELACREPLRASANQNVVYLTERYRNATLAAGKLEYRIGLSGEIAITGFPTLANPIIRS
ncbi:MAG: 4Fe-4S single cluster domain-containing protein [Methylococcaceae bacterium]